MDTDIIVAKLVSNILTPFGVAAMVSIVFSWFSPIGVGSSMSSASSAAIGMLTLCVLPFAPILYSARTGRSDLEVSDLGKRGPLYLPGLASYAGEAAVFFTLHNRIMFLIARISLRRFCDVRDHGSLED